LGADWLEFQNLNRGIKHQTKLFVLAVGGERNQIKSGSDPRTSEVGKRPQFLSSGLERETRAKIDKDTRKVFGGEGRCRHQKTPYKLCSGSLLDKCDKKT
jgi:hypothetical protein